MLLHIICNLIPSETLFFLRLSNVLRLYIMYTCISFLAIFSLAEESKSYYRLDNMNESYDDDTGINKSTYKQ